MNTGLLLDHQGLYKQFMGTKEVLEYKKSGMCAKVRDCRNYSTRKEERVSSFDTPVYHRKQDEVEK